MCNGTPVYRILVILRSIQNRQLNRINDPVICGSEQHHVGPRQQYSVHSSFREHNFPVHVALDELPQVSIGTDGEGGLAGARDGGAGEGAGLGDHLRDAGGAWEVPAVHSPLCAAGGHC